MSFIKYDSGKSKRLIEIEGHFKKPIFMTISAFQLTLKDVNEGEYRSRVHEIKTMMPIIAEKMMERESQEFELPSGKIRLCLFKEPTKLIIDSKPPLKLSLV